MVYLGSRELQAPGGLPPTDMCLPVCACERCFSLCTALMCHILMCHALGDPGVRHATWPLRQRWGRSPRRKKMLRWSVELLNGNFSKRNTSSRQNHAKSYPSRTQMDWSWTSTHHAGLGAQLALGGFRIVVFSLPLLGLPSCRVGLWASRGNDLSEQIHQRGLEL